MKKLAILVTALLLCCGCSEKKQDDDISDNIPEVTTETEVPDTGNTVAETGFRTYKDDDFKTIKVSLSYPDKKAPVDVTSFLIPEHDYGAKIAPCKTSKDPSEYIFVADDPSFKDSDFLETPEKGVAEKAFLRDGKIYTIVNYDNMCIEGHEWSVYSYDTLKMKFDEVYSYSELSDYTPILYNSFLIDDKLIFEMTMGNSTVLRSINLRNGREKDIYTLEDPMVVYSNGSDKLLLFIGGLDVALKEFDIKTGKERVIIKESDLENESVNAAEMSDIPAYTCRNPHREGIRLVTEYYSIETGILNADIVYASKTRFIARQNAGRNEVHTYDLEKMEHYVTRLNGNDCLTASFDGNFVLSELEDYVTGKEVYYVDPELGVAYLLSQNDIFELHRYGSSVEYYTVEPVEIHFSESGCFNAYKAVSVCSISEKE